MNSSAPLVLTQVKITQLALDIQAASLRQTEGRYLLGIAGLPASGKSTLAEKLVQALNQQTPNIAKYVPLDGFHYPNDFLDEHELRHCKGAPRTFDVQSYLNMLELARLSQSEFAYPVYDRQQHEPTLLDGSENTITPAVKIVITEGNYLLLDQYPWTLLTNLLDACFWLDTPKQTATRWLIARHIQGGRTEADAQKHFERSDASNMEMVLKLKRAADKHLSWPDELLTA